MWDQDVLSGVLRILSYWREYVLAFERAQAGIAAAHIGRELCDGDIIAVSIDTCLLCGASKTGN